MGGSTPKKEKRKKREKKALSSIFKPNKIKNELKWALAKKNQKFNNKIYYYKHHLCHAASAFYPSGFKKSSILK